MWTESSEFRQEDKVLWAGVLRRAIFDYVLYKGAGRNRIFFKTAHQFIFEGQHAPDGLSFEGICGLFGWDPEHLRRLTDSLTIEGIKKIYYASLRDEFIEHGPEVEALPHSPVAKVITLTKAHKVIGRHKDFFPKE